jgi:hypothetical protein
MVQDNKIIHFKELLYNLLLLIIVSMSKILLCINLIVNYLFYRCVYSDSDVTAHEKKLIKSINIDNSKKKKHLSIDLCEPKRISCDINPLYYSLGHYEDFSSSEFSDIEQCTQDYIESVILNPLIIGNLSLNNMNINLNNSVESHLIKSETNSTCEEPYVQTTGESYVDEKCSVKISGSELDNTKVEIVKNQSCDLKHDLVKQPNISDVTKSFLNLELATEFKNTLDSSANVQNPKINSLVIENEKNNLNYCKPNISNVDSLLNKNLNKDNILYNNDKSNKMNQETDDDLDVVSPHNFETFTVINKNNETGNISCEYNIKNSTNKSEQDSLKNESNNFQTFTVINENIIDNDNESHNDITVNNDLFEPETSNDYKTFTVVNGISVSLLQDQPCSSFNSILPDSKTLNSNNSIDLDLLPSIHTPSEFNAMAFLSPSNQNVFNKKDKNVVKEEDLSISLKNGENEYNLDKYDDIVPAKEEISILNEFYYPIDLKGEETIKKEVFNTNNFNDSLTSNDNTLCSNMIQNSDAVISSKLYIDNDNTNLNFISENNQRSYNLNYQHSEKLKSTGESDSTLSLHLEIFENNKGMNSPDSLNEDEVFGLEEKPVVSNKLEFVPLESTPLKDTKSPRLSRKYMESSPVITANAYIPDVEILSTVEEKSERKNSSSFFIDFNEGNKPKNKPKRFENLTKSLDSSTISNSKEKIFSMFIDFNEDSESSESSSKGTKHRKPQTLADRFVRMHSEEASNTKSNDNEDTVTPPPSRMTSTVENSSVDISESCKKQSIFMFIENDSPTPVKRRSLPQSSRLKSQRNSWNVDSTVVHKTHHRTHSINLSEESHLDARMTQSHIETGSKEFYKPQDSFDIVECNVSVTVNGAKDSGIGLVDSFVRLSDMDKAPSQDIISSLNKNESKSESLRRDLKNTELGRCLKRMFPYLKSTEVERILLSKPPHSLNSKEEIKTGLGKDLLRMFLEEIGADTTIDVNGRRIKAHKCVLTSRCQYFAAMFSGGWVQSAGNVLYLKG